MNGSLTIDGLPYWAWEIRADWSRIVRFARKLLKTGWDWMDAQRRAAMEIANRKARDRAAFRRLFFDENGELTADGKRVLSYLARHCYGAKSPTTVSHSRQMVDPIATAHAAGKQDAYFTILKALNADPVDVTMILARLEKEDSYE